MKSLIKKIFSKNRTISSRECSEAMEIIASVYPIEVKNYPAGTEYQTWQIPQEWNPVKAELLEGKKVIASYEESPLFLAPYSRSFSGWVNKEDLLNHILTNPSIPDAFCYEFRLAYDYNRRLKEWRISVPFERVQALSEGPFYVNIEVETRDGSMLIGEYSHEGSGGSWVMFLAHYCHIGQANDGLAGVAVVLEAVRRIRQKYPKSFYGYKALLMPETIGSSVYASTHEKEIDSSIGAVFSEMSGADTSLQLVLSRRGDTYIDRVFLHVLKEMGKLPKRILPFRKGWGNDELVFDSPGVGVPTISLDRYPFEAYHTHHDNLSLVVKERLEEIVEIFTKVADLLESDYIPKPLNRVPIYMTRFNLYADWTQNRTRYDLNTSILESLWTGLSVLDIALSLEVEESVVREYVDKLAAHQLIEKLPITPAYARQTRFLPRVLKEA